jgi:hypothetical protein
MSKHVVVFTHPNAQLMERHLYKREEEKKGLFLPGDLKWTRENGHTLVLDDLDESAVKYFEGDPDFSIRDAPAELSEEDGKSGGEEDSEKNKTSRTR